MLERGCKRRWPGLPRCEAPTLHRFAVRVTAERALDICWDRADAHVIDGARTPTPWLRHRLRTTHTNAVVLLKQARGFRDTPQVRDALLAGELSFDQADQLLHVFTPARAAYVARDVDTLIDHISSMPAAQCRIVARVDAEALAAGDDVPPEVEPTISELRIGEILDGDTIVEGVLNASDAAVVRTALAAAQRLGKPAVTGDDEALEDGSTDPKAPIDPRTPAQQRADALVLIAQFFLDHHDHATQDGGASINRAHVNVVVNLDQLTTTHLTGNAESPYSLSGLDMAAVLQTCCDASVTRFLTTGPSLTLDIGRETRVVSPALRKAVTTRDRTCRFPGCDMPAWFTDVHHIWHWTWGGPTDRTNCCLLCRRHHTLSHKGRWTVTGNPNTDLMFTGPEGESHRSRPPNPQLPKTPPGTEALSGLRRDPSGGLQRRRAVLVGEHEAVAGGFATDLLEHDLYRPGERDGQERTHEPEQFDPEQHAQQDYERVHLHCPGHDRRLQDAVFELLVDDEEHQRDDAGRGVLQEGGEYGNGGAERGTDERDQVGERNPEREDGWIRYPEEKQTHKGRNAGDEADEEIPDHVSADRCGGINRYPPRRRTPTVRDEALNGTTDRRSLREEHKGCHEDRHEGQHALHHAAGDVERLPVHAICPVPDLGLVITYQFVQMETAHEMTHWTPAACGLVYGAW